MHELHLVGDLVRDLLSRAMAEGAERVTLVRLRLGKLSEIDEDTLRELFEEKTAGTLCEGAELVVETSTRRELTLVSFEVE